MLIHPFVVAALQVVPSVPIEEMASSLLKVVALSVVELGASSTSPGAEQGQMQCKLSDKNSCLSTDRTPIKNQHRCKVNYDNIYLDLTNVRSLTKPLQQSFNPHKIH